MAKIGYARVSTQEQSLDAQLDALERAGCDRVYSEHATGATTERPELAKALDHLRPGDTLVIFKLDRLGRSMRHLVEISEHLGRHGMQLQSLQDGVDTNTAQGRFFFNVMASMAEFERDLIRERTQAGLKAAKARGREGGRRPKLTKAQVKAAKQMIKSGESVAKTATAFGVGRSTLYRYIQG